MHHAEMNDGDISCSTLRVASKVMQVGHVPGRWIEKGFKALPVNLNNDFGNATLFHSCTPESTSCVRHTTCIGHVILQSVMLRTLAHVAEGYIARCKVT